MKFKWKFKFKLKFKKWKAASELKQHDAGSRQLKSSYGESLRPGFIRAQRLTKNWFQYGARVLSFGLGAFKLGWLGKLK